MTDLLELHDDGSDLSGPLVALGVVCAGLVVLGAAELVAVGSWALGRIEARLRSAER